MDEGTALLNLPVGYTLVRIDPASDTGGIIDTQSIKFDFSGPVPVILDAATGLPTENLGLSSFALQAVEA
jgi:hypothetical protein